MKLIYKKFSILGLIVIFLFSAIMCCCIDKMVEAKEAVTSCHQTAHNPESSNDPDDCDCDQNLATFKKATFINDATIQFSNVSLDQQLRDQLFMTVKVNAYQAPPLDYDTSPLYIKYSILRI